MSVEWGYFDKFEELTDKYLLPMGEGETKASQIVTAICKLVFKWYNDGDVFDNTSHLEGWANDLSSYANWLYEHTSANDILDKIYECYNDSDYEDLLKELADYLFNAEYLAEQNKIEKVDTIYKCEGKFEFYEGYDDEDDDYDYDYDYDYEDEDEDEDY